MLTYRIATAHRVITFFDNRVRWKITGYLVCLLFVPSQDFCSIGISLNGSTSLRSDILSSCQASVGTRARSSFVSLIDSDKLSRVGNDHENTDATFIADLSSSRYRGDEPAGMNFARAGRKTQSMLNVKRREERKRTANRCLFREL